MKRLATVMLIIFPLLMLSACQSVPPVPEHKYYRLHSSPAALPNKSLLKGAVTVLPFSANGLYSERTMLFSSDGERQLQQYHYQHWLYAPGQVTQEFLAVQLQQAGLGVDVHASKLHDESPYLVSGRVIQFERLLSRNVALVKLELCLEKKGKCLWLQTYSAEEPMKDKSIPSYVMATENALKRIAEDFVTHLRAARLDDPR